jgi:two-component system, LytTR family, sensor kinase
MTAKTNSRLSPFWTAQLLGWGTYALAKSVLSPTAYPDAWRVILLVGLGLLLSLPLRSLYRHLRAGPLAQPVIIAIAVVASFVMANVWLLLFDGFLHWQGVLPFQGWDSYAMALVNKTPVLLTWSALYLGIKHWQDLQAERERALRSASLAKEAQLEMLRYQLQPHFLFNALNSLRALIAENPGRAREMVTELSGFLRYSLLPAGNGEVALADEIASIRRFLAIEQIRFEERLQVEYQIEPGAESRPVPSFLLHPLAENAVKYGVRTSAAPVRLKVSASTSGRTLLIEIANTGRWCDSRPAGDGPDTGAGVGLANVRQRLEHLFPGRHSFAVTQDDGWVRARIELVDGVGE